ncbi:MAG: hypothetical protein IIA72_11740 [Proteobacteria bacterium]|nr:hypothetical protein [Pseudomonadota bacterium]
MTPSPSPTVKSPALARALAYPFAIPEHSYLYIDGDVRPLDGPLDGAAPELEGRVAVLAVGSNAAPRHLEAKFGPLDGTQVIPVERARLFDFDSVYSAHVASYGSIPATLTPSPGTELALGVTWLTADQLSRMHETEGGNYRFGQLSGIRLVIGGARTLDRISAYVSVHGCLAVGGAPAAVAGIAARNRKFAAMSQLEVLGLARDRFAPGTPLDDFILAAIGDAGVRRRLTAELKKDALTGYRPALDVPGGIAC